jgi:acyl-CoA thioesterase I
LIAFCIIVDTASAGCIASVGDSLTFGWMGNGTSYPSVLQERLPEVTVYNFGVPGDTTAQMIARFDQVLEVKPNFIIINGGVNDEEWISKNNLNHKVKTIETNIETMIKLAKEGGATPVLSTMTPASCYGVCGIIVKVQVNKWIKNYAKENSLKVIDFDAAVSKNNKIRQEYDSGDGCHMNAKGYRAMGNAIDLKIFV